MRELATIQRRFCELVTSGEGVIDRGLLGSSRRLDIYANAYVSRLHDVLADDYPKLRAALGHDAFHDLTATYVRACPPTSFTVRDAGLALSAYLATRNDMPPWAADLAALERARVEVFDRADDAALTRDDLAAVPIEEFPDLELVLVRAAVLVRLRWTVDERWSAIEEGEPEIFPAANERSVLVWRRGLRVVHRTLDPDEAELATLLVDGSSLAVLSARLVELGHAAPEHRMVELLTRWVDGEALARGRRNAA